MSVAEFESSAVICIFVLKKKLPFLHNHINVFNNE